MAVKIKTKDGLIDISNGVIATVVGGAATSNYGVVGMASKNAIRDGFDGILNRANYKRGVVVKSEDNEITVDVYIIVGYGLKISEVSKIDKDTKELIVPRFSTSRWLHQLDKNYNSLTEEEQYILAHRGGEQYEVSVLLIPRQSCYR